LCKHLRCQKKRKKRYGKYDRRSNHIDDSKIQDIMERLNTRPRKMNGYKTSIQVLSNVKLLHLEFEFRTGYKARTKPL